LTPCNVPSGKFFKIEKPRDMKFGAYLANWADYHFALDLSLSAVTLRLQPRCVQKPLSRYPVLRHFFASRMSVNCWAYQNPRFTRK